MRVKKNNLILCLLYVWFVFFSNLYIFSLKSELHLMLRIIGHTSLICLITFCCINGKMVGRFLNYANVFIVVLYVFHFGQLIIYTYFQKIYSHVRFLLLLTLQESVWGFQCIYLIFSVGSLGIIFYDLKINKCKVDRKAVLLEKKNDMLKITRIIMWLTFPVKVIIDIGCFGVSIMVGGSAARIWMNSVPNVFVYWGKISLIALAIFIIINRENEKKQKAIFVFTEIYILLMMISGIRSENVGYLLVMAFLYISTKRKRIKLTSMILYMVVGSVVLSFIMGVGEFRLVENKSISSFANTIEKSLTEENAMLHLIDNLGDTGYTAQCVINKWLPQYGASKGDSYYLGITAIIPNIPGIADFFGEITERSCFAIRLQKAHALSSSYINIGGSLIGELVFNFGIIGGAVTAMLLGMIIGAVSKNTNEYLLGNDYRKLTKYIAMMFAFTYWVRSYFGSEIREMVWGPILFLIVGKVFLGHKQKGSIIWNR